MTPDAIRVLVRSIPDFPRPGIVFRDVTTLIGNGEGFAAVVDWLAEMTRAEGAQVIAGIEARGFIFGAASAAQLRLPFVPIRKPGKLPMETLAVDYALEYGADSLEIDPGAIADGARAILIDDLLATGGTAVAGAELLRRAGGIVDRALFCIDLPSLGGRERLGQLGVESTSLISFAGE